MPQSFGNFLGQASGMISQAQSQINQAQQAFSTVSGAISNPSGAVSSLLGGIGGQLTSGLSGLPSLSSLGGFSGMLAAAGGFPTFEDPNGLFGGNKVAGSRTQTLEQLMAREDPAWQFQWSVDAIVSPMGTLPAGCRRPDDFIEAFDVVFPGAQPEDNSERGKNAYYAGYMDGSTFTLTFFEYHDWRVTRWLEQWRKRIYDSESGCYGVKDEYAGQAVVSLLDLSRRAPMIRALVKNIWPTQTNPIQLGGLGERITIQQEFSQDDIEVE